MKDMVNSSIISKNSLNLSIMSVVIFNGSRRVQTQIHPIQNLIETELTSLSLDYTSYILRDIEIISCTGCFKCWDTPPGICTGVSGDIGEDIKKRVVNSNLLVFNLFPELPGAFFL